MLKSDTTREMLEILDVADDWYQLLEYTRGVIGSAIRERYIEKHPDQVKTYRITERWRAALKAEIDAPVTKNPVVAEFRKEIGLKPGETSTGIHGGWNKKRLPAQPVTAPAAPEPVKMVQRIENLELVIEVDETEPVPAADCADCDCLPKRVLDALMQRDPGVRQLYDLMQQQEELLRRWGGGERE